MASENTSDQRAAAEEIYLAVYEKLTFNAEYFQSTEFKQLLPELTVLGALGVILHALIEGFLERWGEKGADYLSEKIQKWESGTATPDEIVDGLAETLPMLERAHDVNWDQLTTHLALELAKLGLNANVSELIATDVCRTVRDKMRS